jgi:NIMA (never in mitosis gene a)-related kinase
MYSEGVIKLGDLNVSKVVKQGLGYTQTGTPYYASPEVWEDKPYDTKSDIWSLGCVIYEMTSLLPPFTAPDMKGLFKSVTKGVFLRIRSAYSNDLWNTIKSMISVNPAKRPFCKELLNTVPIKK